MCVCVCFYFSIFSYFLRMAPTTTDAEPVCVCVCKFSLPTVVYPPLSINVIPLAFHLLLLSQNVAALCLWLLYFRARVVLRWRPYVCVVWFSFFLVLRKWVFSHAHTHPHTHIYSACASSGGSASHLPLHFTCQRMCVCTSTETCALVCCCGCCCTHALSGIFRLSPTSSLSRSLFRSMNERVRERECL